MMNRISMSKKRTRKKRFIEFKNKKIFGLNIK